MDIVEFIEKVYEHPLMEWQKEFVQKACKAVKNNKSLIFNSPRRPSVYILN